MSNALTRRQAVLLGLAVLAAVLLGGYGLARIADKQGLWSDSAEVTVGFAEAHDLAPGTPVRIRGVEAGQVVAVEYPDHDEPGAEVTVRMKLDPKFASRLYSDGTATIHGSGVFGAKVIAIHPGTPAAGPLTSGRLKGIKPFDISDAVAELRDTAGEVKKLAADVKATSTEARGLIKDVRESDGTFAKLVKDDELYRDLKEITTDAKSLVKRTDKAVGTVESEMANLKGFVNDGRDTLKSVKQNSDAVSKLPVIRSYVSDANAILIRPAQRRDRVTYPTSDLFEAATAILTPSGRKRLEFAAEWLSDPRHHADADVVVVAYSDPNDPNQTSASAQEMTKKQSEVVIEFLKSRGVHKLGWISRRKMTPLGMGMNPSPVVEKESLPLSNLQIQLFSP